ncbi:Phospholipid phosphatase 1 [Halotydeus destructor]|nr:Phospholipid phosphatase 1 [Halotydeus destructor]
MQRRTIVNCSTLVIIGGFTLALAAYGTPVQRAFRCDDPDILYPVKEATISKVSLFLIAGLLPLLGGQLLAIRTSGHKTWTSFWTSFAQLVIEFAFGPMFIAYSVQVAKLTVGRLRPNFMELCMPRTSGNGTPCPSDHYVTDYTCTRTVGPGEGATLSFFSGHCALAAYAMVYLVLALQRTLNSSNWVAVRVSSQMAAISLAFYVAFTRVSDYWHHGEDVAVGLLLGAILGRHVGFRFPKRET